MRFWKSPQYWFMNVRPYIQLMAVTNWTGYPIDYFRSLFFNKHWVVWPKLWPNILLVSKLPICNRGNKIGGRGKFWSIIVSDNAEMLIQSATVYPKGTTIWHLTWRNKYINKPSIVSNIKWCTIMETWFQTIKWSLARSAMVELRPINKMSPFPPG